MKAVKKIGIWMDHSIAHISEYVNGTIETKVVTRDFSYEDKKLSLAKGESLMHNKQQQYQHEYYKKLGEIIRNNDEVILFGPTDAKTELLHILRKDHLYANIKIETRQTDKMTEEDRHTFVKEYFEPGVSA
jgi:hypothetical protein